MVLGVILFLCMKLDFGFDFISKVMFFWSSIYFEGSDRNTVAIFPAWYCIYDYVTQSWRVIYTLYIVMLIPFLSMFLAWFVLSSWSRCWFSISCIS
jgi:hypothetical protein